MATPTLEPLPDHRDTVIVVGTSLRKSLVVLQPYFASLAWQELPPRTRLHYVFVDDFAADQSDARDFVREWLKERGGELLRSVPGAVGDFADGPEHVTHQWSLNAMRRVGANKNKILRRALELKADYAFFADSDLIMDTTTLASLIAVEKPIATAVYWTHWQKQRSETQRLYAQPQVWLRHPYMLDGRGMDAAEFLTKLVNREVTRVWGFGACTLINRKVLETGIDFSPALDIPQQGLMAGEDRQYCIKVERGHIDAFADPWPDIFHIYHADQRAAIPEMVSRLAAPHPTTPAFGALVALRLEALEPLPHANGGWMQIARQFVRGRLGALPLMPELEEAVYGMQRGDVQIVPVHCPVHYTMPYLRGKRRLVRVQLVDTKPLAFPPVLEDELRVSRLSQRMTHEATLTPQQRDGVKELALA